MSLTILEAAVAVLGLALPAAADGGPPQLRFTQITGEARVFPLDAPSYTLGAADAASKPSVVAGDIVEIASGRAALESDLHATLNASAGCGFRYSLAHAADGNTGMRLSVIPGAPPLALDISGVKLTLWEGGRVALYDGGRLSVEASEVAVAPGSMLNQGERMSVSLYDLPGHGMAIGDGLSLRVPTERGFGPGTLAMAEVPLTPAAMTSPPPTGELAQAPQPAPAVTAVPASIPAPAVARHRRHKKARSEAMLASRNVPFESKDETLRNAVGAVPEAPPAARELPAAAPPEQAVPPQPAPEPSPMTRNEKLGIAAGIGTLLLALIEWSRAKRAAGAEAPR